MKAQTLIVFLVITLTACSLAKATTPLNAKDTQDTAIADGVAKAWLTQTVQPSATPILSTATPTFDYPPLSVTPVPPGVTPTSSTPSPYEADHKAIRKVIERYFEKIYLMHNNFIVDNFDNTVSMGNDSAGFRKTELREQAMEIAWARSHMGRYASYNFFLDYSEIVVFDAGKMARANFTEGNAFTDEESIPIGIVSQTANIKHIMILKNDTDGWRIVYDVHDDYSHRSLYAPTELPETTLAELDDFLKDRDKGQPGPVLPKSTAFFIPSEPDQLNRWKEYETALAKKLMPQYSSDKVICEWELTEKSEQELIVWANCMAKVTTPELGSYYFPGASVPVLVHLDPSGAIESMEIPEYGHGYLDDFHRLFPNGAWTTTFPNLEAMEKHLHWRRLNPTEPPLIVLNATAILKVTPGTTTPTP